MAGALDQLSVRRYDACHGGHSHGHFQILIGLEGALALEVEGRGQVVAAGDGLVIAPGDRHEFESAQGARCLVLDSTDPAWARRQALAPAHDALALARYLASASSAGRPRAQQLGPALLLEAWAPELSSPVRARRVIDWHALQIWVQAHVSERLSVADLATRVHLSSAQFTDRCRQELGLSPMAWLRDLRLTRARDLRASGLQVGEVARRCGYQSPSALTAALKRASSPPPAKRND